MVYPQGGERGQSEGGVQRGVCREGCRLPPSKCMKLGHALTLSQLQFPYSVQQDKQKLF